MSHHQDQSPTTPTNNAQTSSAQATHADTKSADTKNPYRGWQWLLAAKLVWRDFKGGELFIVGLALVLAVTVIATVASLTDRLERAFITQSQSFLAAESLIQSSKPLKPEWVTRAQERGLNTAIQMQFPTMIQADNRFQLTSVKAVSSEYPLMGYLEIQRSNQPHLEKIHQGPNPGEAWLEPQLMQLLGVQLGDRIELGHQSLLITAKLLFEPDRGLSFVNIGSRLMMHLDDVEQTGIIQPGSRVRHRLLLSTDSGGLDTFLQDITPELTEHDRIMTLDDESPRVANTLERAQSFLYLSASLAVILACVAISLSCRRYSLRHSAYVAVLKSLGLSTQQSFRLYSLQIIAVTMSATLVGILSAWLLQSGLTELISQALQLNAPNAHWLPLSFGALAGFCCTLGFALPPLWQLSRTPPMRTLQEDWTNPAGKDWYAFIPGPIILILLIAGLTKQITLTAALMLGIGFLIITAKAVCQWGMNALGQRLGNDYPSWRLVAGSIHRRSGFNTLLLAAFGGALMAMATLYYTRNALLEEWRLQIPDNAPNHYLVNITPQQVEPVKAFLESLQLPSLYFYPSVRARVTAINNLPIDEWPENEHEALDRELNLSWSDTLPLANKVEVGRWWQSGDEGISVELDMAEKMGLSLGDRIHFSVGGLPYSAKVINFRSLNWDTMTPNFYMLFAPGNLDNFPKTYIGSFHLPKAQKSLLIELIQQFPTVSVIELDKIITRIQNTINQVSITVEGILVLMLMAGFLVLISGVKSSIRERLHEAAILRALGGQKSLIQSSIASEFLLIGVFSGLMAALGAQTTLVTISHFVLKLPATFYPGLWIIIPLMGGLVIGAIGTLSCRSVFSSSPLKVLSAIH